MQRDKLGLSFKRENKTSAKHRAERQRKAEVIFLKTFKRKECVKYVKDLTKQQPGLDASAKAKGANTCPCYCGAPESEHNKRQVTMIF